MADLTIEHGPPSRREKEIRALFERAGKPEFQDVYERVYRRRERSGLRSWVRMQEGRAVLHISVAPHPFTDGTCTLMGGLPADLMADDAHRDFWGPIKLVKGMVADVKREHVADFLLTSYAPVAEAVFRAAGFRPFATLKRFVMPLAWPYRMARRMMRPGRLPRLRVVPFREFDGDLVTRGLVSPGCFRPRADAEFYATRMPRLEYPEGVWLLRESGGVLHEAVLIAPRERGEALIADLAWRAAEPGLDSLLASSAAWAASAGYRRLAITSASDAPVARAARRVGFLERPGDYRVLLLPCGEKLLPPPEQWWITPFVLTAW